VAGSRTTLGVVGRICQALVEGPVGTFFCIPHAPLPASARMPRCSHHDRSRSSRPGYRRRTGSTCRRQQTSRETDGVQNIDAVVHTLAAVPLVAPVSLPPWCRRNNGRVEEEEGHVPVNWFPPKTWMGIARIRFSGMAADNPGEIVADLGLLLIDEQRRDRDSDPD